MNKKVRDVDRNGISLSLDEQLSLITAENVHGEMDLGSSVGKELG